MQKKGNFYPNCINGLVNKFNGYRISGLIPNHVRLAKSLHELNTLPVPRLLFSGIHSANNEQCLKNLEPN
jgi:hypothetical protein